MNLKETELRIIYAVAEMKNLSIGQLNELYLESRSFTDYFKKLMLV